MRREERGVPSWNKVDPIGRIKNESGSDLQRSVQRGVVEKVGQGKYTSLAEAGYKNGIRGAETLVRWIKQYGREDMLPQRIKVETVKDMTLAGPRQARAGDITYIRTDEGFLYLALIPDMWPRKLADAFKTRSQAKKAIEEAMRLFNIRRPHLSLNYKTPEAAHSRSKAA